MDGLLAGLAAGMAAFGLMGPGVPQRPLDWGRPDRELAGLAEPPRDAEEALDRFVGSRDIELEDARRHARIRADSLAVRGKRLSRSQVIAMSGEELSASLEIQEALASEDVLIPRRFARLVGERREELLRRMRELDQSHGQRMEACAGERDPVGCRRAELASARRSRTAAVNGYLAATAPGWATLRAEVEDLLQRRQGVAERVVTATTNPALLRQVSAMQARSWRIVAGLADELARDTQLAATLAR